MLTGAPPDVPPGVVTVTPTSPDPGGATALIDSSLSTVKDAACAEPKPTAVAPVNPLPVIVTLVPLLSPRRTTPSENTRGAGPDRRTGKPAVRRRRSASKSASGALIVRYAAS